MGPTLPPLSSDDKKPYIHPSTNDDHKNDNGIHPLYPSYIEHPFNKGGQPSSKPAKKPTKNDSKFPGPYVTPTKTNPPNKHDFDQYENEDHTKHENIGPITNGAGGPGPGFFNPQVDNTNKYNPYAIPNGDNRQELLNILGGNSQPDLRIEHIIQHIQGNGDADQSQFGNGQQHQNGLNYPFGIGQQPNGQPPQGKA